ncbi:PREDICTED: uncharacterized protein LOC109234666 [Nicotiana attenuata]|uniref:uncharacterized protein LOC109234666 n=1 Tax=Nicotiana attenuata TaxID=49451 RepID=UPI000904FD1A|nr:PREDICTED: uncharacterized protein LOC109234666 [Nicotiana attenuata]
MVYSKGYWKGNHDLKSLIATFLTPAQEDKLSNGPFKHIIAMENLKCSMKLVHYLCLSRIFTNDRDSISFKIFGHDVSFTLEDFHIMCGLRITTHNIEKPFNRECTILKHYFGKSKGVYLKDIRSFMTRNVIPTNAVNYAHVCESDDDAVRLMEILIVDSILFGKDNDSCVNEEYASIVEDEKVSAEYPWGNVAYEKLINSLKYALDKQNKHHATEYKLTGFPYPLCVWFYERFPDIRKKYVAEDEYLDMPQVPRIRIRSNLVNAVPSTAKSPLTLSRSKELNRTPVIGKSPPTKSRSKEANQTHDIGDSPRSRNQPKEPNQTPFIGEASRTKSRSTSSTSDFDEDELLDKICSRLTMEEYFDEKFEQLFTIVNKSNGMDREYDRMNDCCKNPSAFEGDQNVQEQVEEQRCSVDRLSRYVNDEAHLSTENIVSEEGAHNQVFETEEHTAHDALRGEEQSNVCRQSKVGEKGADDQVVGTEKHAPSCASESDQAPLRTLNLNDDCYAGVIAICNELLGSATQEIVTTVEVETSCGSIATTQKFSGDAQLNEGRFEKNLPENTAMVVDVGSELNDAGNADIEKGMQPGETTADDKRKELLEVGQKELGEILQQYEKGEIHIFTPVDSQTDTGSVGMKTPSVSQHLDQISSDASELLPKPKRRKISSSPMCDTSDIPNFNLCSFSLGSTQGADSEGNSAAVVVREETKERREQ